MTIIHGGRRSSRREIYYPESDGKPMGETGIHVEELIRVLTTLQDRFAGRPDAYVGGNMMFYWEEGNPRLSISPDVFVVFGVPKLPLRRVFRLWAEAPPATVFEITSRKTRREDQGKKRDLYARIGVREYVLYDPLAEYLRPALQGYRLEHGEYHLIEPDAGGGLMSETLDARLVLVDGVLRFFDRRTGAMLLSRDQRADAAAARAATEAARADAETQRAEAEAARAEAEARRASAAEARVAELEARLARQTGEQ